MQLKLFTLWWPPYRATQRSNTIGGMCSINWANSSFPVCIVESPGGLFGGDNAILCSPNR